MTYKSLRRVLVGYDIRSIDKLSGPTTGRPGDIGPTKAHTIRGTEELALLCYLWILSLSVMTTDRTELFEHGHCSSYCEDLSGTTGSMEQRTD